MALSKATISEIVSECLSELVRLGALKPTSAIAQNIVSERITKVYFSREGDPECLAAIQALMCDPYYDLIPLYWKERKTHEQIAEYFNCDTSTVYRQKKRLLKKIYDQIAD